MQLLLKSITREKHKIIFKNGRTLKLKYIDSEDKYVLTDNELSIITEGKLPIIALEEYGNRVYELYLKYYGKNEDIYLCKKINELLEEFHNH